MSTEGIDLAGAGITKGLHTTMKLIHQRAYGFLKFNNDRLRVMVL